MKKWRVDKQGNGESRIGKPLPSPSLIPVLADASFFVALFNDREQWAPAAVFKAAYDAFAGPLTSRLQSCITKLCTCCVDCTLRRLSGKS